jgi:hypothetical protein
VALVAVIAGVVAATAGALSFTQGDPCQDISSLFVCPGGAVGAPYSITLKADGGNGPPYTYFVRTGSLPSGLSLNSNTGVISGTPTVAGTSTVGIELQDKPADAGCPGCGCVARNTCAYRDFKIDILAGLSIDNQSVPAGTLGQAYSQSLTATLLTVVNPPTGTPANNVTWSLNSGSVPPGIALSAGGVLSGTPTAEGAYQFVVKAQRDATQVDTETLAITVRQPIKVTAPKPFSTSPVPTVWEVGVPFAGKLTPSGGSGTYTLALASGSLPTGLALGADGSITGTPHAAGIFEAVVKVTDSETRTLDYQVNFGVAARLAITTTSPLRAAKVGKQYVAKLKTTGGTLPRGWRVTVGPLPRGIRLDRTTGVLSGAPTKTGTYKITVQVTDGLKVVATKKLRLDVLDA